jgi:NADH:ubiquinone oxidoreductase subunit 3 (subunit A)
MDFALETYYPIFLYLLVILAFCGFVLVLTHSRFLKPMKPTPVKNMPYESGMDPVGGARQRFDVKFYLLAILFLVFDVELLFLYPWAVATYGPPPGGGPDGPVFLPGGIFRDLIFWEVILFLATLAVAYVYAWRKGVLRWH